MADSASPVSGVTDSNTVIPVSPVAGRAAQQASSIGASIPTPGALLTLGSSIPSALTYDSAGLLRALTSSSAVSALLGSGAGSTSVVNAAALTGVNSDATGSGQLNAPVSLQTVPLNAQSAVQSLLSGLDSAGQAAAIASLQADALNQAASNLSSSATAAAVINASGSLQTLTPDAVTAALAGLQGTDLGLTAAGLGVNAASSSFLSSTGLLLAPGGDSTSQALSGLLTTSLNLANTQFSANLSASPTVAGASQTLGNVLASEVNLSAAAARASETAASSATVAAPATAALTTATATPIATLVTLTPSVIAPTTPAPTATTATAATVATPPTETTNVAATAAATAPAAGQVAAVTQTVNQNFLVDAATQARSTITQNPDYAAMAATLYVHAATFRAMPGLIRSGALSNVPPPVTATFNIRPLRPV
ncbi:MAG TPA: hypothetical protein VFW68_09775 [Rhodocyclaceae bacterium]|nr:hypothetical protein [Rhodocyclaceae bacterium]